MTSEIATLKDWIADSDNIVFFGGAGVSTESGIPDFRSVDGLYNQKYDWPPEKWKTSCSLPNRSALVRAGSTSCATAVTPPKSASC